MRRLLLLGSFLIAAAAAAQEEPVRPQLVLLPFDNVSGAPEAGAAIRQNVVASLGDRGWAVAGHAAVDTILEEQRIRYLDTLAEPSRRAVVAATGARGIVSGSIYSWSRGTNPAVAVSARLIRPDGSIAWSDIAAFTSDDTEGPFGFGRAATVEKLASVVVERLLRQFPSPGGESRQVAGSPTPAFRNDATAFRVADLDPSVPHRVCILPFENDTATAEASRIVAEVLALRLAAVSGFEVVDPSALREAALRTHVASFRNASAVDLSRLASAVGTSLFIRGTVYEYADTADRQTETPSIDLEFTLTDVDEARVLWTAQHERRGDDYTGLLLRGSVLNAVALADRTVSEMIDAESHRAPRAATEFAAARAARAAKENRTRNKSSELKHPRKGTQDDEVENP